MPDPVAPPPLAGFGEFVTERFPFAWPAVGDALDRVGAARARSEADLDDLRRPFAAALASGLNALAPRGLGETTPGVPAEARFAAAVSEIVAACDGFLRRAAIRASLSAGERREILRGMVLTRATDNRLKTLFTGG